MARDYAARCPVYPMRNAWLVAAAVLLAAQGKCERAQLCFLQWKSRHFFASCSLVFSECSTFPGGQPAFPECWMFDGVTSPRPLWLLLRAPRPIVKVYCPSSTSDLCAHMCVCWVSVSHETRGVALLVCGVCPNSAPLSSAGDCSGNLILPEPLQTLTARLTWNLCLPVGKRGREMGRNHNCRSVY